jgi:hypothetical protein
MDTVLLAVTILSLGMALALAFIVTRLIREERARSEARVNALSTMAVADVSAPPAAEPRPAPAPRAVPAPRTAPVPSIAAATDLDLFLGATPGDADLASADAVNGVSHLFEEADAPSPWGRRFAVIGVLAAIVLAIGFALASVHTGASASPAAAATGQQPPVQPAVLDGSPLELVALHHRQEADRLVISGLVQNPRSGRPMSHVVATAFLFGPDGAFLTSSRAPIDFTTLSPGDESAFVINVPVTGQIARYRVGFRTDDGRVIEHVDKRAPDAMVQK